MSRRSRHASPYGNGNRYRDPYDAVEEVDDYYYREDRPRHSSSRRAVSPGDRPRPSSTRRPRQDHSYDDYYYQEAPREHRGQSSHARHQPAPNRSSSEGPLRRLTTQPPGKRTSRSPPRDASYHHAADAGQIIPYPYYEEHQPSPYHRRDVLAHSPSAPHPRRESPSAGLVRTPRVDYDRPSHRERSRPHSSRREPEERPRSSRREGEGRTRSSRREDDRRPHTSRREEEGRPRSSRRHEDSRHSASPHRSSRRHSADPSPHKSSRRHRSSSRDGDATEPRRSRGDKVDRHHAPIASHRPAEGRKSRQASPQKRHDDRGHHRSPSRKTREAEAEREKERDRDARRSARRKRREKEAEEMNKTPITTLNESSVTGPNGAVGSTYLRGANNNSNNNNYPADSASNSTSRVKDVYPFVPPLNINEAKSLNKNNNNNNNNHKPANSGRNNRSNSHIEILSISSMKDVSLPVYATQTNPNPRAKSTPKVEPRYPSASSTLNNTNNVVIKEKIDDAKKWIEEMKQKVEAEEEKKKAEEARAASRHSRRESPQKKERKSTAKESPQKRRKSTGEGERSARKSSTRRRRPEEVHEDPQGPTIIPLESIPSSTIASTYLAALGGKGNPSTVKRPAPVPAARDRRPTKSPAEVQPAAVSHLAPVVVVASEPSELPSPSYSELAEHNRVLPGDCFFSFLDGSRFNTTEDLCQYNIDVAERLTDEELDLLRANVFLNDETLFAELLYADDIQTELNLIESTLIGSENSTNAILLREVERLKGEAVQRFNGRVSSALQSLKECGPQLTESIRRASAPA